MPFAVGGGIKTLENIQDIIAVGAEKVIINSYAAENPNFIREAADAFGSSTIAICIDIKSKFLGKPQTWINAGTKATGLNPVEFAKKVEQLGAGEIIVQCIERDGLMQGYDINTIKAIAEAVTIPVVALGGAGTLQHLKEGYQLGYANGLAGGSIFVYKGTRNGVLITYPEKSEIQFI
jgi:cyclase